jgi:uncharacterized protein (TIGR02646 family)
MRTITKLSEPRSLAELRARPGAVFDERGLPFVQAQEDGNPMLSDDEKQELRMRLWEEQRGLCCYCGCGISPTEKGMRIEHWKPLRRFHANQLDYWNLMAACTGGTGQGEKLQYCDVHKGEKDLSRNPSNPQHRVDEISHYRTDGEVRSSDPTFDSELGQDPRLVKSNSERVLNLNLPFLKNNRKSALDALKQGLQRRGTLHEITLRNLLAKWSGEAPGQLDPYAPVIVFWLKKRLKQF